MLETNNPYMFNSSNTTPNKSNEIYYSYQQYQGQPAKLNSAFSRPSEDYLPYTYKIKRESSPQLEDGEGNKRIKRKKEMNFIMEELNQDFLRKRESLYLEKLNAINQELKEAKQDKHMLYLEKLKDLEKVREKMIRDGSLFKEYQKEVTENQFQLEMYQAEEEYTAEQQEVRDKLFSILEEKRRKLKEEKDNYDLSFDMVSDNSSRLNKRNLRKRGNDHFDNKANKKKQMTGPTFTFKLKDDDIMSDIQAMRSGITTNNTLKKSLANKKK